MCPSWQICGEVLLDTRWSFRITDWSGCMISITKYKVGWGVVVDLCKYHENTFEELSTPTILFLSLSRFTIYNSISYMGVATDTSFRGVPKLILEQNISITIYAYTCTLLLLSSLLSLSLLSSLLVSLLLLLYHYYHYQHHYNNYHHKTANFMHVITHQRPRTLKVREITKSSSTFSATNISSNMVWLLQLHDTIQMKSNCT